MATQGCWQRVKILVPRSPALMHSPAALFKRLLSQVTLETCEGFSRRFAATALYSSAPAFQKPYKRRLWNFEVKGARKAIASRVPRREQPALGLAEKMKHSPGRTEKVNKNVSVTKGEVKQHVFGSSDFCDHRGMQIVFLGTSSSMPTLSRNTSCIALRLDAKIYMFDCGEGVQRQFHRTPFRQRTIDSIFITHMHGDHVYSDFQEGLMCMIGMTAPSSKQPIQIFGPQGLRQWIRTTLKLCHARIPIKYAVHEIVLNERSTLRRAAKWNLAEEKHDDELPGEDISCSKDGLWHVHEDDKYVVVAGLLKHSIPCWGYVVQERPRAGRYHELKGTAIVCPEIIRHCLTSFIGDVWQQVPEAMCLRECTRQFFVGRLSCYETFSVDQALKAGVLPGPLYALLQQGQTVSLGDGRLVKPSDVLGPPRKGRKVVILGDTSDSRSLLVAAKGADVVVHEATVMEQDADLAADRGHSTASMAGKFARSIDANTLVLTHFSGKLEGSLYGTSEKGTIADLVKAAKKTFQNESVIAASDLTAVTVMQQDEPASPAQTTSSLIHS